MPCHFNLAYVKAVIYIDNDSHYCLNWANVKMKYLCCYHRELVQNDEQSASKLWHGAMLQAVKAYQEGRFELAQLLSGSAVDIAIVRLTIERYRYETKVFLPEHLADSGRMLVDCLCQIDQFDEAEEILVYLQNYFLKKVAEKRNTYDEKKHYIRLLEEFSRRATALLRMRGKSSYADTISLLCNKIMMSIKRQYSY